MRASAKSPAGRLLHSRSGAASAPPQSVNVNPFDISSTVSRFAKAAQKTRDESQIDEVKALTEKKLPITPRWRAACSSLGYAASVFEPLPPLKDVKDDLARIRLEHQIAKRHLQLQEIQKRHDFIVSRGSHSSIPIEPIPAAKEIKRALSPTPLPPKKITNDLKRSAHATKIQIYKGMKIVVNNEAQKVIKTIEFIKVLEEDAKRQANEAERIAKNRELLDGVRIKKMIEARKKRKEWEERRKKEIRIEEDEIAQRQFEVARRCLEEKEEVERKKHEEFLERYRMLNERDEKLREHLRNFKAKEEAELLSIALASDKALEEDFNRAEEQRKELLMERIAPLEDHKLRMKKVVHRLNKLEKAHNRTLERMIKTIENSDKKRRELLAEHEAAVLSKVASSRKEREIKVMELQKAKDNAGASAAEYRAKLAADIADKEARAARIQDDQSHFVSCWLNLCCSVFMLMLASYREKSRENCESFTRKAPRRTWQGLQEKKIFKHARMRPNLVKPMKESMISGKAENFCQKGGWSLAFRPKLCKTTRCKNCVGTFPFLRNTAVSIMWLKPFSTHHQCRLNWLPKNSRVATRTRQLERCRRRCQKLETVPRALLQMRRNKINLF